MNARALVWRVMVPVSAAIFLLVAFSVSWRAPAPYPAPLERPLPALGPAVTPPEARADPVRVRAEDLPGAVLLWAARPELDEATTRPRAEALLREWERFRPTVLLVGPELGFLLPRLMDPVRLYGEEGAAAERARALDLPIYTWAPDAEQRATLLRQGVVEEALGAANLGRALVDLAERGERALAVADRPTALRVERPLRAGLAAARTAPDR